MLSIKIEDHLATCQEQLRQLEEATRLDDLVRAAWQVACWLTIAMVEQVLEERSRQPREKRVCATCGKPLESKGRLPRQMKTPMGTIRWKRQVRRCPAGCRAQQVVPFDEELGVTPYQGTVNQVKWQACLLAIFVPFETASTLLEELNGIQVSASSIWRWVQEAGHRMQAQLDDELQRLEAGIHPEREVLPDKLGQQPLLMGVDGVMVPFRPQAGSPKGKVRWREVKVGILARLTSRPNRAGQMTSRLAHRRLVAMVGPIGQFAPRLRLEALRQGIEHASCVVWLSDGAAGLWGLFDAHFATQARGVLDFYHATQNLWKGAKAWLGGRSAVTKQWFRQARHRLRHGQADAVLDDLHAALALPDLPASARATLRRVFSYLDKHRDHIQYAQLKDADLPIGSGLVESACKWLIQQRFKGVGMRWDEQGFTHLLFLRLAWVNGRFHTCFDTPPNH